MKPSPIRPQLAQGNDLNRVLLLVDYSNILYRSYFSSLSGWEERPWLPILRFLDSIRLFIQRSSVKGIHSEMIFAGESREKLERTKMDSSYKSTRVPVVHPVFKNFRKIMIPILSDMGISIVSRAGAEADDVIASVVNSVCADLYIPPLNSFNPQKTDVIVFSNDKDLYQLLRFDRCCLYKSFGMFYTKENFIDEYKFHPDKFPLYKAMVGDKSDDISGVNGLGPVKATEHVLNGTIPANDEEFISSLRLIALDYNLDVPDKGTDLYFDPELPHSRNLILDTYGRNTTAFTEIQLAVNMISVIY